MIRALTAAALFAVAAASQADGFALTGEPQQGGWLRGHVPAGTALLTLDGKAVPVARDGAFFLGLDRDARPDAQLVATLAHGRQVAQTLAVAPRHWDIENIDLPRKPPAVPDADYLRLRASETAAIAAARSLESDTEGWRQRFAWPVVGRISGHFGAQRVYRGEPAAYHPGLDIATGASGTVYTAPADGVVVLAADHPFSLEGNLLIVDHGMGLSSAFLHSSALLVHMGDRVRQGQPLGRIGMTGRATGPHLHWALMWRGARLDPLLFVGPRAD